MDHGNYMDSKETGKRKLSMDAGLVFPLDELNQDLLESVLSWLPTSSFFRLGLVAKRWKSVATSATFRLACSQTPCREPWYFMVDSPLRDQWVVFDSVERNWKKLRPPPCLQHNNCRGFTPVAASGGLICFHSAPGEFIVSNPLTGSFRQLIHHDISRFRNQSLQAIAINSTSGTHPSSYKLMLVFGEFPNFSFQVYNSANNSWGEEVILKAKVNCSVDAKDHPLYFLSKTGNVVVTDISRSPSRQYSSVYTVEEGEEVVYFLSSLGTIVACNLTRKSFCEYPRLLPIFFEYSIDLVECNGEMLVVVLSDLLESTSLRVWKFNQNTQSWNQVSAMPPAMSHEFYGKKVDINCTGAGHQILVCINSSDLFRYFLGDLVANEWVGLPSSNVNGKCRQFMSAFSFEPRIEASA